ncbi:MAG: hypothetical protein JXR70_17940 [Spirochaetales bacterium]|nr:hypothetical protein [Spirochaetales bacterium]
MITNTKATPVTNRPQHHAPTLFTQRHRAHTALGIGAMAFHFFKNGRPKRFCLDKFQTKTFGGASRSGAKPGLPSPRAAGNALKTKIIKSNNYIIDEGKP